MWGHFILDVFEVSPGDRFHCSSDLIQSYLRETDWRITGVGFYVDCIYMLDTQCD